VINNARTRTKLIKQANEIIKIAESSGLQSNYFFTTTFQRYQVQLEILLELTEKMEDEGMLVTKEYVKGSKNLYVSPAVSAFNRTADSANKTVMALIKIIKEFNVDGMTDNEDLLLKTINGEDEDE
jgi:tRNA(Phe) wybutosine-synthesizing methylase Tyw3